MKNILLLLLLLLINACNSSNTNDNTDTDINTNNNISSVIIHDYDIYMDKNNNYIIDKEDININNIENIKLYKDNILIIKEGINSIDSSINMKNLYYLRYGEDDNYIIGLYSSFLYLTRNNRDKDKIKEFKKEFKDITNFDTTFSIYFDLININMENKTNMYRKFISYIHLKSKLDKNIFIDFGKYLNINEDYLKSINELLFLNNDYNIMLIKDRNNIINKIIYLKDKLRKRENNLLRLTRDLKRLPIIENNNLYVYLKKIHMTKIYTYVIKNSPDIVLIKKGMTLKELKEYIEKIKMPNNLKNLFYNKIEAYKTIKGIENE
jgi:hypothetical protein